LKKGSARHRKMVQFVIVVGCAACVGSVALGKTIQFDEQQTTSRISTLSKARFSSEIVNPHEICRNSAATGTGGCTDGGGTKYALGHNPCWEYSGHCTGSGTRQCVTGPSSESPDALAITQCCTGGSQHPWIEVCPAQQATRGCGFCVF